MSEKTDLNKAAGNLGFLLGLIKEAARLEGPGDKGRLLNLAATSVEQAFMWLTLSESGAYKDIYNDHRAMQGLYEAMLKPGADYDALLARAMKENA